MSSKELVISQTRHETKVAVLEEGQLVEVFFQRANEYSLAGSIHKGRVTRVLPGMQSAFVDLGLERDCFLYVSDFWEENADEIDRVSDDRRGRDRDRDRGRGRERDRDRDRDRDRPPQAGAAAAPAALRREAAPTQGEAEGESAGADAAGIDAAGRDRRGRRSRRRRRGGRGFPESKYAADGGQPTEETREESSEAEESWAEPAGAEDLVVLPGESLAKYKCGEDTQEKESAETAGLEAEDEAAAEDAAERILDRVEELEHPGRIAAEEEETAVDAEDVEPTEAETGDAVELEEEPPAIEAAAEIVGNEPEPEAPGEDAGALSQEEGPLEAEASPIPEDATATVRAQEGAYQHRISRRTRRRRGGRQQEEPVAGAVGETALIPAEFIAEPVVVEQESRERGEPGDRGERRDRWERGRDRDKDRERGERPALPSIADLLKEGQEIIVQIAKEPLGQKGARITSHIALPGRYVVYMPTVEHLGVSRKIPTEDERLRLKRILTRHREGMQGGFIMRTAGEGRSEQDIANDMQYLANLWLEIREKAEKRRAPALLHHDIEIVQRILRDQLTDGFKSVWLDNEELYEQVLHAVERMQPNLLGKVKLYTRAEPIFDAFGVTQELEKALRPKVWLKSGGYIVINQTEALVAIDVNTGKYIGKSSSLEDTIVKTNLEAVREIVRQMRLRDLGGIIVVDFIDMDERKNRQKVMQSLEDMMRADKAPYKILQFNDFGLVAITRKRVKQSLERALCSPCPHCEGAGYVKSVETIIGEILAQAQKYAKVVDTKDVVLRVNPDVAKELKSVENQYLEELEEVLGRPVLVTSDPLLHQEKWDLT